MHGDDLDYKKGDPWNDPECLPRGGLIFAAICLALGMVFAFLGSNQ